MAGVASARVANRRALHFVYYSALKKTVSRLTKRICGGLSRRSHRHAMRNTRTIKRLRNRLTLQHARCAHVAKNIDEIRIFCAVAFNVAAPVAREIRARVRRILPRAHAVCAYVHSKKILHNIVRARGSTGRNRAKKSESGRGDSRPVATSRDEFSSPFAPRDTVLRRNFFAKRARRATTPHRSVSVRRFRRRVSFSGLH